MELRVKKWFLTKMENEISPKGYYFIMGYNFIGETEKSYKLNVSCASKDGEHGFSKIMFCPKSCVETFGEIKERQQASADKYMALVNFAKEKGLNVRVKMKVATILAMIKNAGFEYNY